MGADDGRGRPQFGGGRATALRDAGEAGLAAASLVVVALPMALIALALLAAQGRPVLFRQTRVGRDGETFVLLKFRTMIDAVDALGRPLPDDQRMTAAGRLMRRFRLDELPQLFAILTGRMAFVGPRPLLPASIESFGALGDLRCSVRPGLTGWAQISGNTCLTEPEKLALDVWYVDHRSPMLDLRILVSTALTLLRGERVDGERLRVAKAHLARAHPA